MKRSETIKAFLDFVDESKALMPVMRENLKQEDDLTQDLLHMIELGSSYDERNRLATALARNRRQRRIYKDAVEEIEILIEWADKHKSAVDALKQTLGKVRKRQGVLRHGQKYGGIRVYPSIYKRTK